ncbi:sigma-54 dependent transcriptional regulator [Candidatus Kuenenia sp.]|uniref:sigma-54-dependent transcriptional regulator n=1 Tax=Candidatus Kuenenia sp. TaxID=2499824 RepID=UPI0032206DC1
MGKDIPFILVVDDDPVAAELLTEVLEKEGYHTQMTCRGIDAVRMGETTPFDVVITDLKMPEMGGLDILKTFKRLHPQAITIVITAFGSFDTAVEAIRNGAYDYISKPFKIEEIKLKVQRCLEQRYLSAQKGNTAQEDFMEKISFGTIIGSSPKMLEIYKMIAKVAGSDVTVLIQGESGTGKELIARAIHDNSMRASKPYIAVNCAALPENLLESELFGYMKGAFTGALFDKKGLFEEADGGTCFLDEIGDMQLPLQAKLLRVLQEHEIRRLGGSHTLSVDLRIIAATNKDLGTMVKSGQFRDDLLYRFQVVTIALPPLRERPEDIPLLANYFLRKAAGKMKKDIYGISKEVMNVLIKYKWPGNIRQLKNVIEGSVVLTTHKILLLSDIPAELYQNNKDISIDASSNRFQTLEELKQYYVKQILEYTNGNQNMAADILGINRKSLYRMLKNQKSNEESY